MKTITKIPYPVFALFLLLVCASAGLAQTHEPAAEYDAVRDFSITSNPNGVWSYGWEASLGSALNLYTVTDVTSVPGISAWLAQGTFLRNPPLVAHNDRTSVICPPSTFCVPPEYLDLHPGINNEVSVVRWTAPTNGNFKIEGAAVGLDQTTTTTTLYVLLNSGSALFTIPIDNYRSPLFFRFPCALAMSAGDTLDFAVDFGADGDYYYDSTGIQFKVTNVR
jgi:hypothetical protein